MRATDDEPQGTLGRVQTAGEARVSPVVSFPPSFARTFSSRERRLGTRQVNGYHQKKELFNVFFIHCFDIRFNINIFRQGEFIHCLQRHDVYSKYYVSFDAQRLVHL